MYAVQLLDSKPLNLLDQPIKLPFRVAVPIGRPDPIDPPVEALKNILPQTIAVPRRLRGMVGRTIALDTQDVTTWLVGVHYSYVDPIPCHADLRMSFIARGLQARQEPSLEITAGLLSGAASRRKGAAIRIFEKLLQNSNSAAISVRDDATGVERSEDREFAFRSSEQHVESPMTIRAVQRAEVLPKNTLGRGSVDRRNQYDVAFVTLHVLQILDEKSSRLSAHFSRYAWTSGSEVARSSIKVSMRSRCA